MCNISAILILVCFEAFKSRNIDNYTSKRAVDRIIQKEKLLNENLDILLQYDVGCTISSFNLNVGSNVNEQVLVPCKQSLTD